MNMYSHFMNSMRVVISSVLISIIVYNSILVNDRIQLYLDYNSLQENN
jgi:hypothetical protein